MSLVAQRRRIYEEPTKLSAPHLGRFHRLKGHHRLHGSLSTASRRGADLEQWQFEVTGGGRIWYLVEETTRTAWITYAGTRHAKATDRR
jgi:glycosyltransferase involved in cell wall biosynthesis